MFFIINGFFLGAYLENLFEGYVLLKPIMLSKFEITQSTPGS